MTQKKINIKLDEKIGEGVYSNMSVMTFSPSEFVVDFGRIVPGLPDARIYSRIMMTPQHAKQIKEQLEKNIKAYEEQFGEIKTSNKNENREIGFKSV